MTLIGKMLGEVRGAHPTPIAWRTTDGMFFGHDGECWLYNIMPLKPLIWEDNKARMIYAAGLHQLFVELGSTSRGATIPGMKVGTNYREFQLLALSWDEAPRCPPGTPQPVVDWLLPVFEDFGVGNSIFAIGIKLRRASPLTTSGMVGTLKGLIGETMAKTPDRKMFAADRALVGQMLARAGGQVPTDDEVRRLESWWNAGRGANSEIIEEPHGGSLSCDAWPEGLEFSALLEFQQAQLHPENGLWLADAFGHRDGCVAVSVRGQFVPANIARTDFRKSQRKAITRIKEQAATGDLQREEDSILLETSEMLESLFVGTQEPLVRFCSVVFARRARSADQTYASMLGTHWGLDVKVLEYRQMDALRETLPLGKSRIGSRGPFSHDMTVGMLAASGIGSYNKVGDESGAWIGTAPPDGSLVWLDPQGASKENKPPSMGVVGEPGAGKTFLLQLIATQATLAGHAVVFINPKSADSLVEFSEAIGGETIKVSSLQDEPGLLDPFRYAEPSVAAEIALSHINTVMPSPAIDEADRIYMAAGLRQAAASGQARCVGEALSHPQVPPRVKEMILLQAEGVPNFGLGISAVPRPPMNFTQSGRLTLVEFDRPIQIPSHFGPTTQFDMTERAGIAAIRLICRSALEQMFASGGGVLIVDEAHVFLASQEGRSILQGLGRTGRSQGILPIMATQRLADLIAEGVDMTSYMGRVFVMKMTDPRETEAALQLCSLDPTEDRKTFLEYAGPVHDRNNPENSRGAMALYRDLQHRVSAVMVGPVPEHVRMRFSTNLLDRAARRQAADKSA